MSTELLNSLTGVAGAIFLAQAASIALLDDATGELVFEAVSGRGRDRLVGARFPAAQGISGSVLQSGEPMIIDNLLADQRFARDIAEETGYVPTAIMAAPLLRGSAKLGVLSVLDRGRTGRSGLQEVALLTKFANQAAIAVELDRIVRAAYRPATDQAATEPALKPLTDAIARLPSHRASAAARLLAALHDLIRDPA